MMVAFLGATHQSTNAEICKHTTVFSVAEVLLLTFSTDNLLITEY